MKLFTLFILLMVLSCNSQKETVKKQNTQDTIAKIEIVKTPVIKTNVDTIITKTNKQNTVEKTNTNNQQPQIEVLAKGSHGGYETAKNIVIKDQKALQQVYSKINMMRRPGLPVPQIDWKNEMVIALFMGQKTSGGYSIAVQDIKTINGKTEINIKETKPQDMATTVICQPFYFYKVKRTDKEIVFKKVE